MSPLSDLPPVEPSPGVEQIFYEALEKTPEARGAYLDHACGGDLALRQEVETLLADHERARGFLNKEALPASPPDAPNTEAVTEKPGTHIGPYKLLEQIGEGGFGTVWVAEQERPVRRRVALKVIKLGMDTREVLARFDQERQALALMDHPNIARMFDAGATPLGRPYFVMELVRGVKITEYCDSARLTTARRLQLFMQVCHAVQHAHQKGVIHRDLKPSNILITLHDGVPVPKVIDFGVAKATREQRLTDLTVYTQFQQMIGTPAYMAPEQAEMSGLDVDTRSDIYSLGVLLYELLTGKTPFDHERLLRAGCDEMRRVLREEDPPKPSTFVSTMAVDLRTDVARLRSEDGGRLVSLIRGDLDWIAMKALEKDRSRRYDTASSLAEDIGRHLTHDPVLARPHSAGYRFRRFARRNRAVLTSGAGVAVALAVGTVVSVSQARRAHRESERATAALRELRSSAPAFAAMARGLAAREKFDDAIASLTTAAQLRPDVTGYILAKADLLQSQLRFAEAAAAYQEAARLDPSDVRAQSNARLSERLAAEFAVRHALSRESLVVLFAVMTKEQRSAAEMLRVGRLLGEENKLLLAYWTERLKELPISPDKPIQERLAAHPTGELELDLSNTEIVDLKPLEGMPLGSLNLSGSGKITDLDPLQGMPLKALTLNSTEVADLSPLTSLKSLVNLRLRFTKVQNISPLRGLSLRELDLGSSRVKDLSPLQGMPLQALKLPNTAVSDITPLQGMPLRILDLSNTKVTDISPLSGLRLEDLDCTSIPARDFSPLTLAGAHLRRLSLSNTSIGSVSVFGGMPLKYLDIGLCFNATDLEALGTIKSLEVLTLPHLSNPSDENYSALNSLRDLPHLRSVSFSETGESLSIEEFWKVFESMASARKLASTLLVHCREGRFADALRLFRNGYQKDLQLGPDAWMAHTSHGMLLLANGEISRYQEVCREAVTHSHRRGDGDMPSAYLCLLSRESGIPAEEARRLMPHLALINEHTPYRSWFVLAVGLLEYRAGRISEAIDLLDDVRDDRFPGAIAAASAILAMAHQQQGNIQATTLHIARCKLMLDSVSSSDHSESRWRNWLGAWLLLKEAEELIDDKRDTSVEK